jgi:hypothetical protein
MEKKQKWPKLKKLRTPEGTIVYHWDGKLHNWEGPALIPQGENRKREYYLYGEQYTEEEWKEAKRNTQGLPWFKNPAIRESARQGG